MPNEVDSSSRGEPGVAPAVPAEETVPGNWVLEDIGRGFALLHPPARLDEVPFPSDDPARAADYDWAQGDPEVRRRYGGLIVAVRDRQVWGAGPTPTQAAEDAAGKPGCPQDLVYVCVWPDPPDGVPGRPTS